MIPPAFAQTAPVISRVTPVPSVGFGLSDSVALTPGSAAAIYGTDLANITVSAAAPGQPQLGGVEIHLVDTSCQNAACELVANLLRTSPTRIDFTAPAIPDITRVWKTRVVMVKNGQRYDNLTAADGVLLDAVFLEAGPNPALTGQPVTFKARVPAMQGIPGSPYYLRVGTVTFMDGDIALAVVDLSNVITYTDAPPLRLYDVSFTTSKLTPGTHTIRADYSGDYTNNPKSSGTLSQAVSVPEISLFSTPDPSIFGDTVSIVATLNPATCTGTVEFYDLSAPNTWVLPPTSPLISESGRIGTAIVDRGRALMSTAAFMVGNHPITVKYSGDSQCGAITFGPGNDYPYRTISQTVLPR
ncbi:MAG TPA: Ig-like domain-containing protein [Candidatus Acidoferrales bacterium]|nr:Ig-like domain-containing protein [Candidatus Acidoferrales bacterium]HXK04082.1 Ig-like domain-containing protein [Verrucomicrobiae bacterium]